MTCCVSEKMKISLLISSVQSYLSETVVRQLPQFLVVDGQQRLATLSLLISALGRAIEAKNVDIRTDRSQSVRGILSVQ